MADNKPSTATSSFSRRKFMTYGTAGSALAALHFSSPTESAHAATVAFSESSRNAGFSAGSEILWEDEKSLATTLDKIVALGGKTFRFDIPWYWVENRKGVYDWTVVDRIVAAGRARKLTMLGVIAGSPPWASFGNVDLLSQRPADAGTYAAFAGVVAARFKGKISAYEIWNEPNGRMYFSPDPDPEFYTLMVKAAYASIKKADPGAKVVAGVLGPAPDADGLMPAVKFAERMYAAGVATHFDAFSFHPYDFGGSFAEAVKYENAPIRQMMNIHRLMTKYGDGNKKIWVTEYGAPSTTNVNGYGQDELVAQSLQQWSEMWFAGPFYVYTIHDTFLNIAGDEAVYGVVGKDYVNKPAADAFRNLMKSNVPVREEAKVFLNNPVSGYTKTVSPVYSQGDGGLVQEYRDGVRFFTKKGYFTSPTDVANEARRWNVVPSGTFVKGRQMMDVAGGFCVFSKPATTGTHSVFGAILTAWTEKIGFPVTDQYVDASGWTLVKFENGTISWKADKGTVVQYK